MRHYNGEIPFYDGKKGEHSWFRPLSQWALHQKLRIMQWIVQTGFELDIYQADEMAGMYW